MSICVFSISLKLTIDDSLCTIALFVRCAWFARWLPTALCLQRWRVTGSLLHEETFRFKVRLSTYRGKTCIKTFPEFLRFYGADRNF